MKRFFITVIIIVVLAFVGYGIAYLIRPVYSVSLEQYTNEVGIVCENAYIVRDESVYYSTSAGTVYSTESEGDRVAKNAIISTTYMGNVEDEYLSRLRTLDFAISRLKKQSAGSELYVTDAASVENEISTRMNDVISLAGSNSIEQIHELREDINGLRSGNGISVNDKIAELEEKRRGVEASIPGERRDTISDRSGIFSLYIDGLEAVLQPERIKEYDVSYIKSLTKNELSRANGTKVVVGDPVCKVMDNHEWYVLGITDEDHKDLCKVDSQVTIKFPDVSASSVSGKITYVSEPDENGEYLFLVRVPSYLETAFSYRSLDTDIVFEEYSGYKIPTDAIRTGDTINTHYVYAMKGSDKFKCDCEVLYTDMAEGYSIIQSTEKASHKLSSMERLVVGEK